MIHYWSGADSIYLAAAGLIAKAAHTASSNSIRNVSHQFSRWNILIFATLILHRFCRCWLVLLNYSNLSCLRNTNSNSRLNLRWGPLTLRKDPPNIRPRNIHDFGGMQRTSMHKCVEYRISAHRTEIKVHEQLAGRRFAAAEDFEDVV